MDKSNNDPKIKDIPTIKKFNEDLSAITLIDKGYSLLKTIGER